MDSSFIDSIDARLHASLCFTLQRIPVAPHNEARHEFLKLAKLPNICNGGIHLLLLAAGATHADICAGPEGAHAAGDLAAAGKDARALSAAEPDIGLCRHRDGLQHRGGLPPTLALTHCAETENLRGHAKAV